MSTREVAERLGVGRSTVQRIVQDGKLSPVLRGNGIRGAQFFDPEAVEALAEARANEDAA